MAKPKIEDYCRLCGDLREMTFEHIPPRKAFNDRPLVFESMQDKLNRRPSTVYQRGLGLHSLCESCNNTTGGNFGRSYVEWAQQGLEWLDVIEENDIDTFTFSIRPLNVLKQVCTMIVAMLPTNTIDRHEALRKFVLDKHSNQLPISYGIYVYFTATGKPRFEMGQVVANIANSETVMVFSEVALPPFGYCVVSRRGGVPPAKVREHKLYPIDWFWQYNLNEPAQVELSLPKLPVNTYFPLDYRTEDEVIQQALEQELHAQAQGIRMEQA